MTLKMPLEIEKLVYYILGVCVKMDFFLFFSKKNAQKFGQFEIKSYLCNRFQEATRAFSSAGLEHLPYKQRVGGSNPSTPTKDFRENSEIFCVYQSLFIRRK